MPNLSVLGLDSPSERLILVFVKAEREANFQLDVEALEALAPWFFALDHINYSRWLPVHTEKIAK